MTLSLTNSKMNIHNLPLEILEKILVEGNFLSISRVCQTWRHHAQRKKSQFNEVFFDLTKNESKEIENKNPKVINVYNSIRYEKNELSFSIEEMEEFFLEEISEKFEVMFYKIVSAETLIFTFDPMACVEETDENYNYYKISKNFIGNDNIFFAYFYDFSAIIQHLYTITNKIKFVNIIIKDIYDRIENIDKTIFSTVEISTMYSIISDSSFTFFKKFTFRAPNNTYLIYDKNKKIAIIRLSDNEKYDFKKKKNICKNCPKHHVRCYEEKICHFYPANFSLYFNHSNFKDVEKLIIISFEFHGFMFEQFRKLSKKIKIEYHCLNSKKMKFEKEKFKFVPVEKEKSQEYSFNQIHVEFLG